ncbi:tyrosine-type recombinase/integrase [Janibacter sp. LM]|uniref:tyrosine-type recombinase/integrase n=1 Tax=Janibacter sp. LM TaxID=3144845 RepID=UPI0031F6FEAD
MSRLRGQVDDYLRLRRSLGYKLVEHERFLNQYVDYLEEIHASTITAENAVTWAKSPTGVNPRWHGARLSAVRGFATWAQAFDPGIQVPPTGLLPMRPTRAAPYLYSQDQIRALMNAAAGLTPQMRSATFQTLIGLLAVTGMRAGEATRAEVTDLDLDAGTLTVRGTKFGKTRLLPLHATVVDELRGYLTLRNDAALPGTTALLISTTGTRLTYDNACKVFQKLTARAGIVSRSSACRPRMTDLRHSFAVNTLLDAYRAGADVGERLPVLSTYLGHTEPANTYWYLHAAPELMALAAERLAAHDAEVER